MSLLKEHDGVPLVPEPILYLASKSGDIAEGDVQGFMGLLLLLRHGGRYLDGGVRDELIILNEGEPYLSDLLPLQLRDVRDGLRIDFIVGKPMDIVHREDALVVTMVVINSLVEDRANHLVGGHVNVMSVLREGDVDPGVGVNLPVVFGPDAIH